MSHPRSSKYAAYLFYKGIRDTIGECYYKVVDEAYQLSPQNPMRLTLFKQAFKDARENLKHLINPPFPIDDLLHLKMLVIYAFTSGLLGHFDEVINTEKEILKIDPSNLTAQVSLVSAYRQKGEYDLMEPEITVFFRKIKEIKKNKTELSRDEKRDYAAMLNIYSIYWSEQAGKKIDPDKAFNYAKKATQIDEFYAPAWSTLAKCMAVKGASPEDIKKINDLYERACKNDPLRFGRKHGGINRNPGDTSDLNNNYRAERGLSPRPKTSFEETSGYLEVEKKETMVEKPLMHFSGETVSDKDRKLVYPEVTLETKEPCATQEPLKLKDFIEIKDQRESGKAAIKLETKEPILTKEGEDEVASLELRTRKSPKVLYTPGDSSSSSSKALLHSLRASSGRSPTLKTPEEKKEVAEKKESKLIRENAFVPAETPSQPTPKPLDMTAQSESSIASPPNRQRINPCQQLTIRFSRYRPHLYRVTNSIQSYCQSGLKQFSVFFSRKQSQKMEQQKRHVAQLKNKLGKTL